MGKLSITRYKCYIRHRIRQLGQGAYSHTIQIIGNYFEKTGGVKCKKFYHDIALDIQLYFRDIIGEILFG